MAPSKCLSSSGWSDTAGRNGCSSERWCAKPKVETADFPPTKVTRNEQEENTR